MKHSTPIKLSLVALAVIGFTTYKIYTNPVNDYLEKPEVIIRNLEIVTDAEDILEDAVLDAIDPEKIKAEYEEEATDNTKDYE